MAVLGAALLVAACRSPQAPEPPIGRRAIFILLDAARSDHLSAYGYSRETTPTLDELASRGLLLENHYAQAVVTRSSLPSLLYSRYFARELPRIHSDVRIWPARDLFLPPVDDAAVSFPRALAASGLRTAGLSAHSWLRPDGRFGREFDTFRDLSAELEFPEERAYPSAEQVVDEAIRWLDQNSAPDFFLYLHFMDTHFPHFLDADAARFFGDGEVSDAFEANGYVTFEYQRRATAEERRYLDAIYDGSLRYTDRQIGRLVEYLRGRGELDDTLIVVTSDHGEHLWEEPGRFGHRGPWLENVARVPLILFYPGRVEPRRVSTLSGSIDVAPTLYGLLDVPLPPGKTVDGENVAAPAFREKTTRPMVARGGIRTASHKAIFLDKDPVLLGPTAPDAPLVRLYDLDRDPGETQDLAEQEPERARQHVDLYRRIMRHRFTRLRNARTQSPPAEPFAIGVQDFRTSIKLPPPRTPPSATTVRGWRRLLLRRVPVLEATPEAALLAIRFALPDGHYRLSVRALGDVTISAHGRSVRTGPLAPELDHAALPHAEFIDIGPIQISKQGFVARLEGGQSASAIAAFRFEPLSTGAAREPEAAADARVRRLRALGYLE